MADGDFRQPVVLGRTGLLVSRLGVGASYGVSERSCLAAFDAGVNYFFWGSARTPSMARAIRQMAARGRERVVVVMQCYARSPRFVRMSVERGLKRLGLDHVDILLLGWHDARPKPDLLETAKKLQEAGRFRFLGISGHDRKLFPELLKDGHYDLFHIRYNAAHRGAEQEIFPFLPARNRPGIASFTNTRWGTLLSAKNMPAGEKPLSAAECYRFALSHPDVHVAICGPKDDAEMQEALGVLSSGPLSPDELGRARAIGDFVHAKRTLMAYLS